MKLRQFGLVLPFAVVLAVAAVFPLTLPRGLHSLSYDALRYLAGAESILARGVYRDIDETEQQIWPPGTSLLYAAVSRGTGAAPGRLPVAVNLPVMVAAYLGFLALLRAARVRTWLAVIAFAALAWNGEILSETNKLWSDPLTVPAHIGMLWCLIEAYFAERPRRAFLLLLAANALVALGILFRFAMLPGAAIVLMVTWWITRRDARFRWMLLAPLLSLLPVIGAFAALDALYGNRAFTLSLPTIWDNVAPNTHAFADLTTQLLPPFSLIPVIVVAIACVVAPVAAARVAEERQRVTIVIALTWIFAYSLFLIVAQAVTIPSFDTVTRILFALYPSMLLAAATAAEVFLRQGRRAAAAIGVAVLSIGAARAAHFIAGSLRTTSRPHVYEPGCVPRDAVVSEIAHLVQPSAARLLSNSQGLAWYALRRPTFLLSRDTLAAAAPGTLVVWVDAGAACLYSTEITDLTQAELLAARPITQEARGAAVVVYRVGRRLGGR